MVLLPFLEQIGFSEQFKKKVMLMMKTSNETSSTPQKMILDKNCIWTDASLSYVFFRKKQSQDKPKNYSVLLNPKIYPCHKYHIWGKKLFWVLMLP